MTGSTTSKAVSTPKQTQKITVYTIVKYDHCAADALEIFQSLDHKEAVDQAVASYRERDESEDQEESEILRNHLNLGRDCNESDGIQYYGFIYQKKEF